jgi:phosphoribosylanthranilate isomerase
MSPRWIKICGVRRPLDAELALALGATHVGCVLAADSPRCATLAEARRLCELAARRAQIVLVFRGATGIEIRGAAAATGASCVQLHGGSALLCAELEQHGLQVLRAYRVDGTTLPAPEPPPAPERPALFDGGHGGEGRCFPWQLLGGRAPRHVFVAGGITADNVGELLPHRPFGIDVGSGVESAPGRKDHGRLRALFAACAAMEPAP